MLPALLNIPQSQADWHIWSFNHRDQHDLIRQAIQAKYNINLQAYQLDPIPEHQDGITEWLENNQQSHDDMNGVVGLQSSDLESVDFNNQSQKEAWIFLHYNEHYSVAAALDIS